MIGPGPHGAVRRRSSILVRVVGALVVALGVATAVTAVVGSRLTSDALARQAERAALAHLSVVQEAYGERERSLVAGSRNLAEMLVSRGLLDPGRGPALVSELGRAAGNLELEILRVLDAGGRDLSPPVGVGAVLASPSFPPTGEVDLEPATRLLRTTTGRFVQAVPVALGTGPDRLILLAGYEFGDPFAYRLRRQIGSLDDVVLVAGGRLAGSSLARPPAAPPAQDPDSRLLPSDPVVVDLAAGTSLVAYASVSRSPDDPVGGALGVVLTNPTAALDRSLAQTRWFSSLLLALTALGVGYMLLRALVRPLVTLAATAERVAGGDPRATFPVQGDDEVAALARSLEGMRRELGARLDTIAAQAAELRASSQRIVAAQDAERQRLARDLHDGLQQQLVVLRMQMGLLEERAGHDGRADLAGLGLQLDAVIERLREVTHDLYPSILVDRGLAAALHSYAGRLPVSVRLTCEPDPFPRLTPGVESAAYFLLGEAVTNALKHSGATAIELSLTLDEGWLRVCAADDGRGFDTTGRDDRGGLLHMEDRVRSFGGTLEITSRPGGGTRVVAFFPDPAEVGAPAP